MPRGWLSPGTGKWIRDYLLAVGEDYPYNIWRRYREWCVKMNYKPPTYENFRRYMSLLKKLGLITLSREERESNRRGFRRVYYKIVRGMEDSWIWRKPYKVMYGKTTKLE